MPLFLDVFARLKFEVDEGRRNVDKNCKSSFKEGVSSMKPCENSFVRWANKGSDTKKEERAARIIVGVDQLADGTTDRDLVIAALSV